MRLAQHLHELSNPTEAEHENENTEVQHELTNHKRIAGLIFGESSRIINLYCMESFE